MKENSYKIPKKKPQPNSFSGFFWNHFLGGEEDLNTPDSICHQVTFWPWTLAGGSTWRGPRTAPPVDKFGASSAPQTPAHVFNFHPKNWGNGALWRSYYFSDGLGKNHQLEKCFFFFFFFVNGLLKMRCMFFFFWLGPVALYAQNIAAKHQEDSH